MGHCDEALKKIGRAVVAYQRNNDGANPATLAILLEVSDLTAWDFVCPAGGYGPGESSYIYRGDDLCADLPDADEMILAYDRSACHKGRRNVLFADGAARRPTEQNFEKAIEKDNQIRRQFGLAKKASV